MIWKDPDENVDMGSTESNTVAQDVRCAKVFRCAGKHPQVG